MSLTTVPSDQAREEAADWFARLKKRDVPASDLMAFKRWRRLPGHKEAYDEVDALWRRSAALARDPQIQDALSAAMAKTGSPAERQPEARGGRLGLTLGLCLVAALVASAGGYRLWGPRDYETGVGEQRLVRLADGSTVELDTGSKVSVRYSGDRREIRLEKGQALFDVAHDATRPFLVTADGATVRALGTRFDVRRRADGVEVILLRGSVEVRENKKAERVWRLTPGQAVTTTAAAPAPTPTDVTAATSWTQGRLVFHAEPLSSAVAEVNRYNHDQIVLDATELAHEPISGQFDSHDNETFVAAVAEFYGLSVSRPEKGVIRLSQAGADRSRP